MNEDAPSLSGPGARPLRLWMLGLMGLAGFGPLLVQFFANQWRMDARQFFPLALVGTGLLAWRAFSELKPPLKPGSWLLTLPLMLVVLALLFLAAFSWSPWIGMMALLLAIATAAWSLGGWTLAGATFPAWILLATIVPLPLNLDARLALSLQACAVAGSSRALALLGVPHVLSGNVIEIPGYLLLVDEACSGIISVTFMTSACVFYAMWRRRSLPGLVVLYGLTIICVLTGNALRITACAWLLHSHQINLFKGWKHDTLGIVFMLAYLLFIVFAEAMIPRRKAAVPSATRPWRESEEVLLKGRTFGGGIRLAAVALALMGATQILFFAQRQSSMASRSHVNPKEMDGSARFSLPAEIGGWRLVSSPAPTPVRTAFEDGVYSHIWQYEREGVVTSLALDYPFFGYHDVRICYHYNGWNIVKSRMLPFGIADDSVPCMEVSLLKKGNMKGLLLYSTVDERGRWVDDSKRVFYSGEGGAEGEGGLAQRLLGRKQEIPFLQQAEDENATYRIQLLANAGEGLTALQHDQVLQLFQQARTRLVEQFLKSPSGAEKDAVSAPGK